MSLNIDSTNWYERVEALFQQAVALLGGGSPGGGGGSTATTYTQILQADDLIIAYTYEGLDTPDQRVTKIRHTAASLGKRFDDNLAYTLTGTGYVLMARTRVVEDIPA